MNEPRRAHENPDCCCGECIGWDEAMRWRADGHETEEQSTIEQLMQTQSSLRDEIGRLRQALAESVENRFQLTDELASARYDLGRFQKVGERLYIRIEDKA